MHFIVELRELFREIFLLLSFLGQSCLELLDLILDFCLQFGLSQFLVSNFKVIFNPFIKTR